MIILDHGNICVDTNFMSGSRNFFSYACSGQRQFSTVSFSGFGFWVRVLCSDNHNRFPNSNPNLITTLTLILH